METLETTGKPGKVTPGKLGTQRAEQPVGAQTASGVTGQKTLPELAEGLRYMARQPILDLHGRVHGYELLFRSGPEDVFRGDGVIATRTMLDNTVIFGLERMTGGLPAFVNCTEEALTGNLVNVLPSSMTVLEILENLQPTRELIDACRKLKASGFRLALDDFTWAPEFEPLLALADYVKVDFVLTGPEQRRALVERLNEHAVALVAEKVETQKEYKQACAEGFTLFQGFYFCRPELMENHKVPVNHLSYLEILQLLRSDSIDLRKLTRLVKRDAALTYRLLRLVNSPLNALRQEVRSVQGALLAVGEDSFRRIATLAITSELSAGRPAEILRMAFVRGRFCELAAGQCGLDPTEQYLLGMLSLLPAMLRLPMQELAPTLALREEIRAALLGRECPERVLLSWMESQERGDWAACDALAEAKGLEAQQLGHNYAAAVLWAEDTLHFAL
jgi:EAL and modified HD-GYP domain-containing signal transduction protein